MKKHCEDCGWYNNKVICMRQFMRCGTLPNVWMKCWVSKEETEETELQKRLEQRGW